MRHLSEPTPSQDSAPQHVVTEGPNGGPQFVVTTDAHGSAKRLVVPAVTDATTLNPN